MRPPSPSSCSISDVKESFRKVSHELTSRHARLLELRVFCNIAAPPPLILRRMHLGRQARGSALRYALYAILIHSGTATGGHYVAYIQDPDTKDASSAHSSARTSATSAAATSTLATSEEATRAHDNSAVGREEATGEGGWFCFNDAHVTPLSERDLRGVMGLEPRSLSPKEAGGGTRRVPGESVHEGASALLGSVQREALLKSCVEFSAFFVSIL